MTYDRAPGAPIPALVEPLGSDAEGRGVYGSPYLANSRKHLFLTADEPPLVGYVRADPPPDLSLGDVVAAAISEQLPRPEALALLGVLTAKHVVLIDGCRLGGPRGVLAEAVARVALEPVGFVTQVVRVTDWALLEAARLRWDSLVAQLLAVSWVRELADPDFGFVRTVTPRELIIARTTRDPIDVGELLVVRSQDNSHADIEVTVREIASRDVRAEQVLPNFHEAVADGDRVYFVAMAATPPSSA